MRDYKHYKAREDAEEGVHITRLTTYLIIAVTVALLSWMTERDSHPFNDANYVQAEKKS